jgi:glyoxylase-like metal-dependent hydrolase (beta-lactamase superfamily II)
VTDAPRVPKQEQMPASEAIDEVAPGILRTQLPIDFTGLGHVNMYVLEDERGVAVVDPGLPNKESWNAIGERLGRIGVPLRRVHTVIVTHSHPDHFGCAQRLRDETGAEIVSHRLFRLWWDPHEPEDVEPDERHHFTRRFGDDNPWGGRRESGPDRQTFLQKMRARFHRPLPAPTPSVRLRDADSVMLAGRRWTALHTPGHTEDHLCLFDAEEGVLLSGDHVLPNITPHVPGMSGAPDPLGVFFASLDKAARLDADTRVVLPAHGQPFQGLARRVGEIKDHHQERLERLRTASAEFDRPASVPEFSTKLFSPRVQGPMAHSETYAHLEHLRLAGQMECRERDGMLEYVVR